MKAKLRLVIIVPTLNSWLLLPRLVESLKNQTTKDWRVLFVDGPSSEEHRSFLQITSEEDSRFSWIEQQPSSVGIYGAMNTGFSSVAADDWLLFWGSDDWADHPDSLAEAFRALEAQACDLLVCQGSYIRFSRDGEECLVRPTSFRWFRTFWLTMFFGSTPASGYFYWTRGPTIALSI